MSEKSATHRSGFPPAPTATNRYTPHARARAAAIGPPQTAMATSHRPYDVLTPSLDAGDWNRRRRTVRAALVIGRWRRGAARSGGGRGRLGDGADALPLRTATLHGLRPIAAPRQTIRYRPTTTSRPITLSRQTTPLRPTTPKVAAESRFSGTHRGWSANSVQAQLRFYERARKPDTLALGSWGIGVVAPASDDRNRLCITEFFRQLPIFLIAPRGVWSVPSLFTSKPKENGVDEPALYREM